MGRRVSRPVLLDTHAWVWSFADPDRLSRHAARAIVDAAAVHVSPISFFEIGQKVRVGKWPEMADHLTDLPELLVRQGGVAAPFTPEICLDAAGLDWDHRDPFDRLLGATARAMDVALVTCDPAFANCPGTRLVW
jgi:PIN domain nuclease of toxin-antitoxin system